MAGYILYILFHIYSGVGYCIVYFRLGHSTTFFEINEIRLHTFF